MGIIEIIEYLEKNGTNFLISSIVVFAFFKIVLISLKWFEQLMLGKKKTTKELKDLQEEDIKIDGEINEILIDILTLFNPDRIMVLQYHNGHYYNSGMHQKFISGTHEAVTRGISSGITDFQNIPSALFQPPNSPLLNGHNNILIEDMDKYNDHPYLQQMYRSLGFRSYYAFALRNKQNILIGKVTLVGLKNTITFGNDDIIKIEKYIGKIELLLNFNITT